MNLRHSERIVHAQRRREPRVLARDLPAELQVAATNGSIVTDARGRKYIDFVTGWCVGNYLTCVRSIGPNNCPYPRRELNRR